MRFSSLTVFAILGPAVAGCIVDGDDSSDDKTPRVVDVAASKLDLTASIYDRNPLTTIFEQPDAWRCEVKFFMGDRLVRLASNAKVTCNGVPLSWSGLPDYQYSVEVPGVLDLPPGTTVAIVHSRKGVDTQANVTVPQHLVITSPAEGAKISRDISFTINYEIKPGDDIAYGVTPWACWWTPGHPLPALPIWGSEQPDNGVAVMSAKGFGTGPGFINIARRYTMTPSASGFSSERTTFTRYSGDVNVTWQ
jgi:hypothetical protein